MKNEKYERTACLAWDDGGTLPPHASPFSYGCQNPISVGYRRLCAWAYLWGSHRAIGVSKSALSTNIHLLLDKELIYYETKEGKRRKYFKSFPFDKRFEGFLELIRYEKDFTMRFQQYMKAQNENEHLFTEKRIHKLGLFLDYLNQIEHLTQDFLKKLKQEEISEKP